MKKEFNRIELTGYCLFIVLIIPFLLLLMAEPTMINDEPQDNLPIWILYSWGGLMLFSVLLIIVGRKLNNLKSSKK